jgi:hypothetical protein
MKHPAVELGHWLKVHRRKRGLVARVFAGQIELSAAQYAEVEAGVVRWLGATQERLIPEVLALSDSEKSEFEEHLVAARAARPLEFHDLFKREQLDPVRLRHKTRQQLDARTRQRIVDAVMAPLR